MHRILVLFLILTLLLTGCGTGSPSAEDRNIVAATTKPVAEFTAAVAGGTDIEVIVIVSEAVSCLHDYTLTVSQMQTLELADAVVISGGGLEHFMEDVLQTRQTVIDASAGIGMQEGEHGADPHIWLDPGRASRMAENISRELSLLYPEHAETFSRNLSALQEEFTGLAVYAREQTAALPCRELVTFHDGFAYFAEAMDMEVLASIEEEHGSETAAKDLVSIISLVNDHGLPAIFTEVNGSVSAAKVVAEETGAEIYALDMGMGGADYFTAMRHNIDTVKEAFS